MYIYQCKLCKLYMHIHTLWLSGPIGIFPILLSQPSPKPHPLQQPQDSHLDTLHRRPVMHQSTVSPAGGSSPVWVHTAPHSLGWGGWRGRCGEVGGRVVIRIHTRVLHTTYLSFVCGGVCRHRYLKMNNFVDLSKFDYNMHSRSTNTGTHTHTCTHACTHAHTHTRTHTCTHTHTRMHTHVHTHTHTHFSTVFVLHS